MAQEIPLDAEPAAEEPDANRGASDAELSDSEYFLADVAISPPIDEFKRTYEKKIRSFENDEDSERRKPFEAAYKLGLAKLKKRFERRGD